MSQSVAYVVKDRRLELDLAILDVSALYLHEETIPELLEHLTLAIKSDRVVKHPIVVDGKSHVVLDGVHRVVALRNLRINRVPACLVDYENPNIKICSWYRTLTGASPEKILALISKSDIATTRVEDFDEDLIGVSPNVAAIRFINQTFLIRAKFGNVREAYDIIGRIEQSIKGSGLKVRYETERDAIEDLQKRRVDAVLCTPRLNKSEIVKAALSGEVFASKATRHIIPARVMNVNVPLALLRDQKKPLPQANKELHSMLQERRLKKIPPGNILEGRRYEEELYVFEE